MKAMFAAAFFIALITDLGLGARKKYQRVALDAALDDSLAAGHDTAWTLSFKGVPCYLKPDLSQLGPFSTGIRSSWDKLSKKILTQARDLAETSNCKACDIDVQGSALPFDFDKLKSRASATVECSATVKTLASDCFSGHGFLGKFQEKSQKGLCAPCPIECDGGCKVPAAADVGTQSKTWFKCITNNVRQFKNAPTKGDLVQLVLYAGKGDPYECASTKFKKLDSRVKSKQYADGEKPADERLVASLRPSSSHKGYFILLCKYKSNYVRGLDQASISPEFSPLSTWRFHSGMTGCSQDLVGEATSSDSDFVTKITQTAKPSLQWQFIHQNCAICDVSFGGLLGGIVGGYGDISQVMRDMTGEDPGPTEPLWVKAECATPEMGEAACNKLGKWGMGKVGWSKKQVCMPCPKECMSCEDRSSGGFKCILLPIVSFPSPALASMTQTSVDRTAVQDLYKLPETLKCTKPSRRECDKNKDWCKAWQFKVDCEYPL